MLPEFINSNWDTITAIVCSPIFRWSLALFFCWLFIAKIFRWCKSLLFAICGAIFGIFSPLRFRRIAFNLLSLVFVVGGSASSAAAKAHLDGASTEKWHAILAGGASLAVYGIIMLICVELRSPKEPVLAEEKKKP